MDKVDESTKLARERTVLAHERSRLANERTFLSWIRTGLASVGGGLAIIRLLSFQSSTHQIISQVVGCVLVILGVAMFTLSFLDYKNHNSRYQAQNGVLLTVGAVGVISFVLVCVSLVLLTILVKLP